MAARIIEQLIEIPAEHERNIFGQFDEHIKKDRTHPAGDADLP